MVWIASLYGMLAVSLFSERLTTAHCRGRGALYHDWAFPGLSPPISKYGSFNDKQEAKQPQKA